MDEKRELNEVGEDYYSIKGNTKKREREHAYLGDEVFLMGVNRGDVSKGDVIQVGDGRLEKITLISPTGNWESCFTTESGAQYLPQEVRNYGVKVSSENSVLESQ